MRLSDYEPSAADGKTPGKPGARPSFGKRHSGALFAGGFGALLTVGGGLLLGYVVPRKAAAAEVVRALPVATPSILATHATGARLLIEARIAAAAPEAFREFVAGTRQEFRGWREEGGRRREQWRTLETFAPPLPIDDAQGGTVRIANSGYELQSEPRVWQSTADLVSMEFGERTQRVSGFARGDAVTVDATLTAPGALEARILIGGTRETYLATLEKEAFTLRIVGGIFTGIGALLAVIAGVAIARAASKSSGMH